MEGIEDKVLLDILSRAVGPESARIAFDALSLPPSVSIRLNPFKLQSWRGLGSATHATLGTVRGGTGAERSDASGGAERSEAVAPLRPFWSDLNLLGLMRMETEGGRERASKAMRARSGPTALERMSIRTLSSIPSISL